jgi:hypothetical protein
MKRFSSLAVVGCVLAGAWFLFAQDTKKTGVLSQTRVAYSYVYDPVSKQYQMLSTEVSSFPSTPPLSAPLGIFGTQRFEVLATSGISQDGKLLHLLRWIEKEDKPAAIDAKSGIPIEARKYTLEMQTRDMSIESEGIHFINAEGKPLTIDSVRNSLEEMKQVVIFYGKAPPKDVLALFQSKTVIAISDRPMVFAQ